MPGMGERERGLDSAPERGHARRERGAYFGGRARDGDARGLEGGDLVRGAALAASDDGARVAHALAGRRVLAGDEGDDGLAHALSDELRGGLLCAAADLDRKSTRLNSSHLGISY